MAGSSRSHASPEVRRTSHAARPLRPSSTDRSTLRREKPVICVDPLVARPGRLEHEADPLGLGEGGKTVLDRPVALAPLREGVDRDGILEPVLVGLGDVGLGAGPLPPARPGDGERLVAEHGVEPGHEAPGLGDRRAGERDLHGALVGVLGVVERSGVPRGEADQPGRGRHRAAGGAAALVVGRGCRRRVIHE